MSSLIIKIGADSKAFSDELDEVKKQTKELEAGLAKVGKVSAIAFAATAGSIGLAVKEAAKFEKIGAQFEVLTGSVESANAVLKDLADFSAGTPFQFEQIAKAGKQLIAFGIETDQVKNRLRELGDVSAATGADFNEVTTIFGQIQAAGKLTGERLLQLQERAIPIGPALAETLGIAEEELKDFVSAGKVSAETFNAAFASLSQEGGIAFGGLEKVSDTLEGKLSTLSDNFSLLAAEVGRQFLPAIKAAADVLINLFNFLRTNPEIAKRIAVFAGLTATLTGTIAAVSGTALAFLKLRTAFIVLTKVFPKVALGIKGLVGATGIGLLLIIANEVFQNWNTIWPATQAIFETFVKNTSKLLGGFGKLLVGAFTLDLDQIKSGFNDLKTVVVEGYENASTAIKEALPEEDKPSLVPSTEGELNKVLTNEAVVKTEQERIAEENKARRALEIEQQFAAAEEQNERTRQFLADENNIKREVELEFEAEKLERKKARQKQFLKDEKQFGKTVAKLNEFLSSEQVKGVEQSNNQLIKLQSSKNKDLARVGRAAARVQIAIDTAKGAIAAYTGFLSIPIVGPSLGLLAASAVIAFGAEQLANVQAANRGGVIGAAGGAGTANVDSQLAALTPGELVAPRETFDQVVEGVAQERGFVKQDENVDPDTGESLDPASGGGGTGGGGTINVTVGTFIGTEEFVQQNVIPAIRDAREFNNGNIGS